MLLGMLRWLCQLRGLSSNRSRICLTICMLMWARGSLMHTHVHVVLKLVKEVVRVRLLCRERMQACMQVAACALLLRELHTTGGRVLLALRCSSGQRSCWLVGRCMRGLP